MNTHEQAKFEKKVLDQFMSGKSNHTPKIRTVV